jgi:hypothetical protein
MLAVGFAAGCREDVPITTEPGQMQDELHSTLTWGAWSDTVLLELEPSERAGSTDAALALIREMVTGDSDGDGTADHFAYPHLRVAVVTSAWADGFFANACDAPAPCSVTPQLVGYDWFPYGFAPASPEPFLDQVRCLLSSDPAACAEPNDLTLAPYFVVVTADDLATKPYAEILDSPGSVDYGSWSPRIDRVLFDDDGRVQCTLRETLPTSGPITHCDQLSAFGRTFDHVDADGRDVCEIEQLAPDVGTGTPDGYGFYYYEGDQPPLLTLVPMAVPYPEFGLGCSCGVFYDYGHGQLLMKMNSPFVPESTTNLRCALTPGDAAL